MLDNAGRLRTVAVCLSFVSTRVCNGEGEACRNMNMCGSLWKDRRMLCRSYISLEFFDTARYAPPFARSLSFYLVN